MNVTCAKCQRRYTVPDEKVVRRVRLRCRNCQHVIEVSPPAAAPPPGPQAANPWEEEATRHTPALDRRALWFAMVEGQQVGPFDVAGLEARVRAGQITYGTLLWRDGMPEWRQADQVPELLQVLAAPPKRVEAPTPSPSPALQGLFDDEDRTVLRQRQAAPAPAPAGGRAGGVSELAPREVDPSDAQALFASSRSQGGGWKWVAFTLLALALGAGVGLLTHSTSRAASPLAPVTAQPSAARAAPAAHPSH